MEKFKSRKFWLTVATASMAMAAGLAGEIPPEQAMWAVVAIVGGYVGIEGLGDAAARFRDQYELPDAWELEIERGDDPDVHGA